MAVLDPWGAIFLFRYDNQEVGVHWAMPGGGMGARETLLQAVRRELLEETGWDDIEPGPQLWTWGHDFTHNGNPCTRSSESSWGTGHAVTRRVTCPQLTLRTESCDGNGGHMLSWRTVRRRCGRHNFPSCSGGCCTKVLRPHQLVSIMADNVRAPRTHGCFMRLGSGEGCHNDDPSRSDRVVFTDEPADEIPAPDLGHLAEWGDRGAVLRDRYLESPVGPLRVVMRSADASGPDQDAFDRGSASSRGSRKRTVFTTSFAKEFAFGDRTGVRITSVPSERNTSSKEQVYLESRSRIRKRTGSSRSSRSNATRLSACWVTNAGIGVAGRGRHISFLVAISMKKST